MGIHVRLTTMACTPAYNAAISSDSAVNMEITSDGLLLGIVVINWSLVINTTVITIQNHANQITQDKCLFLAIKYSIIVEKAD